MYPPLHVRLTIYLSLHVGVMIYPSLHVCRTIYLSPHVGVTIYPPLHVCRTIYPILHVGVMIYPLLGVCHTIYVGLMIYPPPHVCRTIYPSLHVGCIIYPPSHVCRTILPSLACTYAAPFIHCQKLPNIGFNDNVFVPEYVSNTQPLHSLGLDSSKWAIGIVCLLQLKFNHYKVSLPIKLQSINSIKFLVS